VSRLLRRLNLPVVDLSANLAGDPKWHQDMIIHLASILKPKTYVELGIFHCGLFNRMIHYAQDAIGVDANPEAERYMARSPKARFVSATTSGFAEQLRRSPIDIDLLFIDADHSKEAVAEDFANFLPFVRPHGVILLHDTHPQDAAATDPERCGDGYLAIRQLSKQTGVFEMMTLPVHPGLTLCRKRQSQLSWQEPARTDR
jgi:hypothetical protein